MIELLGANREILRGVFEKEFNSALPAPEQANIAAYIENGCVSGFLTSEVLIRVGLLWLKPSLRKTMKGARVIGDLARYTRAAIPAGASVISIGDNKFEGFYRKLGMKRIEGDVYRIDF